MQKPLAKVMELSDFTGFLHNYAETAEELDLDFPAIRLPLLREQVLTFLHESEIALYDYDDVDLWLQNHLPDENTKWVWEALRKKDCLGFNWAITKHDPQYRNLANGRYWDWKVYDKIVPLPALQKALSIEKKFPDSLSFFVSEYRAINPDPFIMCRPKFEIPDLETKDYLWIFDFWNEPGFGNEL